MCPLDWWSPCWGPTLNGLVAGRDDALAVVGLLRTGGGGSGGIGGGTGGPLCDY